MTTTYLNHLILLVSNLGSDVTWEHSNDRCSGVLALEKSRSQTSTQGLC